MELKMLHQTGGFQSRVDYVSARNLQHCVTST